MSEVGKASGKGGNIARVSGRLALLIRAAGDRLFQAEDERARQYGWQVTARRGGLARTYRDPRFDRFRSCPACRGTGTGPAEKPCDRCDGTGRITISQPALADERRE
jgi:RecJ-like exonuclease